LKEKRSDLRMLDFKKQIIEAMNKQLKQLKMEQVMEI
jgi:hypothetical protein